MLFPSKGKTTWKGFVPPCKFKDGDIVYIKTNKRNEYITIFKKIKNDYIYKYVAFSGEYFFIDECPVCYLSDIKTIRFATEEEKQKLFDTIKANGYRWNFHANRLEKLVKPTFKKGDKVRVKNGVSESRIIDDVCDTFYTLVPIGKIDFTDQNNWELVSNKFDISTLKPFKSRVLVRDTNNEKWKTNFWGFYDIDNAMNYPYECCGNSFAQCIPYEGNEHLLGTTNDCDDFYKTWEK